MAAKKRKYPSGHAKREKARLKRAELQDPEYWKKRYEVIGAPPEDGAQRVEWANRIAAELTYEQIVAPDIRTPAERKLILEGVRTLGMTAVKALYEERLRKLEAKVYGRTGKASDASDGFEEIE